MDNQHQKIEGYRELNQSEIDNMNAVKKLGEELEATVNALMAMPETDKRWVAIGKTDLQTGLMALVRSIARPESF